MLLQELTRHADLLSFDYSYSFPKLDKTRSKCFSGGFSIRGLMGSINAQPRGFCTLTLSEGSSAVNARIVEPQRGATIAADLKRLEGRHA